ncbi:hypothetical protein LTR14_011890 [Exophiala xenobiotica]|nr:hypothetical protein LTR14_011890 [Exophiala xenobiotica]
MSLDTDTSSNSMDIPRPAFEDYSDDYIDGQILREVLEEHYKKEDFKLKWSRDRWWLKAVPLKDGKILSSRDLERVRL